jgi:hypothetical protein
MLKRKIVMSKITRFMADYDFNMRHPPKYRQEPVPYTKKRYRGGPDYHAPKTFHIFRMFADPEQRPFCRGTTKMIPSWWDDSYRHNQRSWKEQSKSRHQWQRGKSNNIF